MQALAARRHDQVRRVRAALLAETAGADGITAHLREDRRHIRDADMAALSGLDQGASGRTGPDPDTFDRL